MPTPAFEAHWLAEAIRLYEARHGRLDERATAPPPHPAAADPDTLVLTRARVLAERLGWIDKLSAWQAHARLSLVVLAALASTSGAGLALAVLGDGGRPVNLLPALLGLLGVHLLSLALWLLTLSAESGTAGSALGRLWLRLTRRLPASREVPEIGAALLRLLAHGRLARWLFGMVSHGLWAILLLVATSTLLTLFALRRYGFVWETTILDQQTLAAVLSTLDAVPALVGVAAPPVSTLDGLQPGPERAAWARWLVACVALYGLLPRAMLWLWCRRRWHLSTRRLRIDFSLPDNLLLRQMLAPDHASRGITDPAPARIEAARVPKPTLDAGAGGALVGIELGDGLDWPPLFTHPLRLIERIETRAERRQVLERLAESPPRRLLVAFDARLSPDRGSFSLLAELATHAGSCAAWLLLPAGASNTRLQHWRDGLAEAGIPAERIIERPDAASLWLETANE